MTLNDTSIADVQHVGREVTIVPSGEGAVRVRIEDAELPESAATFAEVLISDVSTIHLDTQGYLVEQGSSMNLSVTAFDSLGAEFN